MSARKWGRAGRIQLLKFLVWEEQSPQLASNWPVWLQALPHLGRSLASGFILLIGSRSGPAGRGAGHLVLSLQAERGTQLLTRDRCMCSAWVPLARGPEQTLAPTTPFASTVLQMEGNSGSHSWRLVGKLGSSWQPLSPRCAWRPTGPAHSRVSAPLPLAPSWSSAVWLGVGDPNPGVQSVHFPLCAQSSEKKHGIAASDWL